MKLGFVSAILDGYSFEEMVDTAARMGFQCVEVACWPAGKAERRYAGVSHIDVENLNSEKADYLLNCCKNKGVEISALAFYPNTMDSDLEKRAHNISHLYKVITAAKTLGVNTVTTFIGRMQEKTLTENLAEFKKVWQPIIAFAEQQKVRIAIENCPMLFGDDQWPGGQNLAVSPAIWREMFSQINSDYFGLNYDPSHFVWQMMDYIQPLYEFKNKIFHVHFKDIKLYRNKLNEHGILAAPLSFMAPKLPGLGDVNWSRFVSALTDIGYDSYTCIEVEDRAFEGSKEKIEQSLLLSKRYMEQFVI